MRNRVQISSSRRIRVTTAATLVWVLSCFCCCLLATPVRAMKGGRSMGGGFKTNYPSRQQSQTKNRMGSSSSTSIQIDSSSLSEKRKLRLAEEEAPMRDHPFLPQAFPGLDVPAIAESLECFVRDRVCPATKRFVEGIHQTFQQRSAQQIETDRERNKKWREIADGNISATTVCSDGEGSSPTPTALAFSLIRLAFELRWLVEALVEFQQIPKDAWDRLVPVCRHIRDRSGNSVRRGVRRLGTLLDVRAANADLWLFRIFAIVCTPRAAFVLGATAGTITGRIALRFWKPLAVVLTTFFHHRNNKGGEGWVRVHFRDRCGNLQGTSHPRRIIPYSLGISSIHRKQHDQGMDDDRSGEIGTALQTYHSNRMYIYRDCFRDPPKPMDGLQWKQKVVQGFVVGIAVGLGRAVRGVPYE